MEETLERIPAEASNSIKLFKAMPEVGFAVGFLLDYGQYKSNPNFTKEKLFESTGIGLVGLYSTMGGATLYIYTSEPYKKAVMMGYPTGYMGAQNFQIFEDYY